LAPNDKNLRDEWEMVKDLKTKKEREWASKMSGFYH
jgi:hypothetical protein